MARNPLLEKLILAQPHDLGPKLVYADWLQTQGDPWGGLIVQQQDWTGTDTPLFRWDDPAGIDASISVGDEPLFNASTDQALHAASSGDLVDPDPGTQPTDPVVDQIRSEILRRREEPRVRIRWRHGFVEEVFVPQHAGGSPPDLVQSILDHRCCILLRTLALGAIERWQSEAKVGRGLDYHREIQTIAAAQRPSLTRLVLGAWNEHDISWTGIGDLTPLYDALPNLTCLELQTGPYIEFGEIRLPQLEKLMVRSGGIPESELEQIHRADWRSLKELRLWFGTTDYGGSDQVELAEPLLSPTVLPAVSRLGLCNAEFTDELCELLLDSEVLPQLEELDLSLGTLTDEGAGVLLSAPQKLHHLAKLDVRGNCLSPGICQQLTGLSNEVDVRFQKQPDEYYVSVAE